MSLDSRMEIAKARQAREPWHPVESQAPLPYRALELLDVEGRIGDGWYDGQYWCWRHWPGAEVVEWRYKRYALD